MSPAETFLLTYDAPVAELGLQLRKKIQSLLPGVREEVDAAAKIVGYGFGPGYKDSVCTIIPSKKGLKLGFYKGSELPDPASLPEGSGKVHKYIVVRSAGDIESEGLRQLMAVALQRCEERRND